MWCDREGVWCADLCVVCVVRVMSVERVGMPSTSVDWSRGNDRVALHVEQSDILPVNKEL